MPTNQELEAMCEQAFPPELAHLMTCPKVSGGPCNCDPFDNNEPDRSKALALAIEVRDKTVEAVTAYGKRCPDYGTEHFCEYFGCTSFDDLASSLLSEAQK